MGPGMVAGGVRPAWPTPPPGMAMPGIVPGGPGFGKFFFGQGKGGMMPGMIAPGTGVMGGAAPMVRPQRPLSPHAGTRAIAAQMGYARKENTQPGSDKESSRASSK